MLEVKKLRVFLLHYVHINKPCVLLQPSLWYHSSALLALALDALTVPYRLRNNGAPMWQVADSLAVSGRKVGSSSSE